VLLGTLWRAPRNNRKLPPSLRGCR
jgi:hypothetical protein